MSQLDASLPTLKLNKLKTNTPQALGNSPVAGSPSQQDALASILAAANAPEGRGSSPKGSPLSIAAGGGMGSAAAVAAKSRLNWVGSGAGTPPSVAPSTKKGRKSQSLATEAITRAAERAMAAVGMSPDPRQLMLLP